MIAKLSPVERAGFYLLVAVGLAWVVAALVNSAVFFEPVLFGLGTGAIIAALALGLVAIVLSVVAWKRLPRGRRGLAVAVIAVGGFFLYRAVLDPGVDAVEAVNPAATGFLGGLGLPVLLAGLRIVLVQNIGLAVIAGLIGGGGYGTFVFQGLNQTATDLILLGALPTVLLAMVAAITMDILVDLARRTPEHAR